MIVVSDYKNNGELAFVDLDSLLCWDQAIQFPLRTGQDELKIRCTEVCYLLMSRDGQ